MVYCVTNSYDPIFSVRVTFHKSCGAHVRLDSTLTTARRVKSFNHGTVVSGAPLLSHQAFQVRIKKVNSRWTGSLMIGVTDQDPDSLSDLPSTASSIAPWIVVSNTVYVDGRKVGLIVSEYIHWKLSFEWSHLHISST